MKEIEGKLPEDKQGPIDAALAELKAAHGANIAGCDAAQEKLNAALQAASAEIQAAMQKPRRWRSRSRSVVVMLAALMM